MAYIPRAWLDFLYRHSWLTFVLMGAFFLLFGFTSVNLFVLLKPGLKAPPPYATVADAQAAGAVTINYGNFINNVVTFIIVAFAVFLIVRMANRLKPQEASAAPATRDCPFCRTAIPVGATRCPHCTSDLRAA